MGMRDTKFRRSVTSAEEAGTKDTEGQSYQYIFFLKLSTLVLCYF